MNLKPLNERVIIKRDDKEPTSEGGILLKSSSVAPPDNGVIVAVSDSCKIGVSEGDKVYFSSSYGSKSVSVDGEEFLIIPESDITAVVI